MIPFLQSHSGLTSRVSSIFANGEPGVWLDPSDFSTMFQDAAGTVPVTAVEQPVGLMLDKSGNGFHAFQTTSTKRTVYSKRVNQYVGTATLATQNVTTLATGYTLRFEGAGTITLSGTASGTYSAGTHAITCTAGTLTSTVSDTVTNADLRMTNVGVGLPAYQAVVTSTDYDAGPEWPAYLKGDSVSGRAMVTNKITPGVDKVQVFAGVRKLTSTLGLIAELGTNAFTTNGIALFAEGSISTDSMEYGTQGFARAGYARDYAAPLAPSTDVLVALFDVADPVPTSSQRLRANGTPATSVQSSGANMGSGNFSANALSVFARNQAQFYFTGHLYGLIVRFGPNLPLETIQQVEKYIANKTGISL